MFLPKPAILVRYNEVSFVPDKSQCECHVFARIMDAFSPPICVFAV